MQTFYLNYSILGNFKFRKHLQAQKLYCFNPGILCIIILHSLNLGSTFTHKRSTVFAWEFYSSNLITLNFKSLLNSAALPKGRVHPSVKRIYLQSKMSRYCGKMIVWSVSMHTSIYHACPQVVNLLEVSEWVGVFPHFSSVAGCKTLESVCNAHLNKKNWTPHNLHIMCM